MAHDLMDEEGNAYLADFGIVKVLGDLGGTTGPDAVIGSLDYLSPEQVRSEPVTPQTDIYSLGVVLYEMLTGQHPFHEYSPVERFYKHINDALPEIKSLDPGVQEAVNAVIQKATAKNPAHRYPDVLAMAAAIREAIHLAEPGTPTIIVEQLTLREHEVLQFLVDGLSNREIAANLFVTEATVKWHIKQIYRKLGVRSRVQAIIRARELDLIVTGDMSVSLAEAAGAVSQLSLPEPENPYKGLQAFQPADHRDFFGREELTARLIQRLGEKDGLARFLAVVGPSGSGKSSLVKAGLIPALWRGDLPGSERWFVADLLPGTHPLDELEVALTRVAGHLSGSLKEHLARDARGLLRAAGLILPNDGSKLVLIIDQFEEVFTLVEDEPTRQHFLDLLYTAVTDPRSRVRVVITLRADFYDRPLHYPDFGELVRSRMETILPLTAKGLERAIAGPAERVMVTFEEGLVATIVAEMNYQAGALPLLQYALTELFERREGRVLTHAAYRAMGGAVGALAKRAEELFGELNAAGQEAVRQMFLRLVTLGEGVEDTRRRTPRPELLALGSHADLMDDILDTYTAYRLLSLDHDPATRTPTVELAHEAMLREWERLRTWLNDSRAEIKLQRQLAVMAAEWREAHGEASFLARGSRLEQFAQWAAETGLALTGKECEYLEASLAEHERQAQAEMERQAREQTLERRSRTFLRTLVGVFALAAIIASGLSVIALNLSGQAARSAAEFRSIALSSGSQQALDNGQPDVALALAQEAVNMVNPPPQSELMFFEAATSTWIRQRYIGGHTSSMRDAVFLPDGQRMVTCGWDGRAVLWDVATGKQLQSIQYDGRPLVVAIHPDGHLAAIAGEFGVVALWNLDTNTVTHLETGQPWVRSPLFNRDGTLLLASGDDGTVFTWDVATRKLVHSFQASERPILGLHFNADESLLITSGQTGDVRIWDFETGDLLQTLEHPDTELSQEAPSVWDALFLPDGEHVLSGDSEGAIYLWDWRSGEIDWTAVNPSDVQDLALSRDGALFATGANDPVNDVHLWDTETGRLIRTYERHTLRVQNVDFSPDGTMLLSASNDGTAILWPVTWDGVLSTFAVPATSAMAVHPSTPLIAVAGEPASSLGSSIRLVNTETGEVINTLDGHREFVSSLAFSPDGHLLVSGDFAPNAAEEDRDVYVWDVQTGERLGVLDEHDGWIMDIAFSPNGRIAAVGESRGARIILWDVETRTSVGVLEGHQDWVTALSYSPDGRFLYSGSRDGSLFQWDVQKGEVIHTFVGHPPNSIQDLDVTGDGTRLVTGSLDRTARVWDTATGELIFTLEGHIRCGVQSRPAHHLDRFGGWYAYPVGRSDGRASAPLRWLLTFA